MAVTILKPGVVPVKLLKFICGNCGCVFTAEKGDTTTVRGDRPFEADSRVCRCPTCTKDVWWTGAYLPEAR